EVWMSALGQKQTSRHLQPTPNSGHRRQRPGRPLSARSVRCRRRRQRLWRNPLDLLAPPIRPDDLASKRHMHAYTTARFIGGQRMGQALSKKARERAGVFDCEAPEVSVHLPEAMDESSVRSAAAKTSDQGWC